MSADEIKKDFDAVILAAGSEVPRDLPVPGRQLNGIYAALEFLIPQNKEVQQGKANPINVKGKHVIVIGGGDTGSDCVGTSNRHGAASVTQFELMPMPPEQEDKPLVWPYWPIKLRTSTSHDEGCSRDFAVATKEFVTHGHGNVRGAEGGSSLLAGWQDDRGCWFGIELPCDAAFLAMGFTNTVGWSSRRFWALKRMRARTPKQQQMVQGATRPTSTRCMPPVMSVAASHWLSGQSAKVVSVHVKSMPS